jgi:hypothetical protein
MPKTLTVCLNFFAFCFFCSVCALAHTHMHTVAHSGTQWESWGVRVLHFFGVVEHGVVFGACTVVGWACGW